MKNSYMIVPFMALTLTCLLTRTNAQDVVRANTRPTINAIQNQQTKSTGDGKFVALTGITPGEESDQTATPAVQSRSALLERIEMHPTSNGNAIIQYLPKKGASGIALVTVTVTDNGAVPASTSRTFSIIIDKVGTAPPPDPVVVPSNNTITLKANPNPFLSSSRITFSTTDAEKNAQLEVYTVSGSRLQTLFNGSTEGGKKYNVFFPRKDLPSGNYLIKLTTARDTRTLQMVLSK